MSVNNSSAWVSIHAESWLVEVKCPTAGAVFWVGGGGRAAGAPLSTVLSMIAPAAHCSQCVCLKLKHAGDWGSAKQAPQAGRELAGALLRLQPSPSAHKRLANQMQAALGRPAAPRFAAARRRRSRPDLAAARCPATAPSRLLL